MSSAEQDKKGRVSRVVPGKFVYVDVLDSGQVISAKPDIVSFRDHKGLVRHYKGEPFHQVGLEVGADVTVSNKNGKTSIVLQARRSGFFDKWRK